MTIRPEVILDSHAREFIYLSITTDPPIVGAWEVSSDQWASTATLETGTWTIDGNTYTHRVLVAGPNCPLAAVPGQVAAPGTIRLEVRNVTAPEATVRPGPAVYFDR